MTASSSRPSRPEVARRTPRAAGARGRRFFLPIGVPAAGARFRPLPGIAGDLSRMARLFRNLGYSVVGGPPNPCAAEVRCRVGDWLEQARLGRSDTVVLYFSGHGMVVGGDHYLCPRGFDGDQIATTGIKTRDLVELVLRRKARPGRFWLILDCCQAGGVLDDGLLGAVATVEADTFVLAASASWDPAYDGSFSGAFCAAVGNRSRTGASRPCSLDRITQSINRRAGDQRAVQASICRAEFDLLDTTRKGPH